MRVSWIPVLLTGQSVQYDASFIAKQLYYGALQLIVQSVLSDPNVSQASLWPFLGLGTTNLTQQCPQTAAQTDATTNWANKEHLPDPESLLGAGLDENGETVLDLVLRC